MKTKETSVLDLCIEYLIKMYRKNKSYKIFVNIYIHIAVTLIFLILSAVNPIHIVIVWGFLIVIFILLNFLILFVSLFLKHRKMKSRELSKRNKIPNNIVWFR